MTQFYVGVKIIEAWPQDKDGIPGYGVKYPDGYTSWSPKDAFERAYLPMGETNDNRVTTEMVEDFFYDIETRKLDDKTVLCKGNLVNGFVQYETSSCVDPKNFDIVVGKEIAEKRIRDTIWKCLGFVVQWGRFGLRFHNDQNG